MKNNQRLKRVLCILAVCIATANYVKAQLTLNLNPSNVNCEGLKTGQITANVSGGMPPYQFKWSNGQYTQTISSLHGGYYHCLVVDVNGNTAEKEITLTEPEEFRIVQFDALVYSNNYNTSCYGCNDGAITVSVTGGTPPYNYSWSDGSNLQNRTNLVAKDYQLVVTDAFGCQLRELNKELSKPERDDWTPNGNSNTNANSFIGTTNQMPLVLKAGNIEALRMLPNSNIGIGTSTPTEKFELAGGNAKFGGNTTTIGQATVGSIKIPSLANAAGGIVGFNTNGELTEMPLQEIIRSIYEPLDCGLISASTTYFNPPHWSVNTVTSTGAQSSINYKKELISCFSVGIKTGTALYDLDVNGTGYFSEKLLVNQKIGIGTSNPTEKLEISDGALKFNTSSSGSLSWAGWNNVIQMPLGSCITSVDNTSGPYTASAGLHLGFGMTNGGWYFIRSSDAIGTNSTSNTKYAAMLNENGEFTCRRVLVNLTSGWSDYVFDKNYKLRPLFEVEKYISENQHLPDVPSAAELKETGVDAEAMLSIQMKKIEELTLYSIELQKKLDLLSLEFEKLRSQK